MTPAISGIRLESPAAENKSKETSNGFLNRLGATLVRQCKCEGLVGDGANGLKLVNFWSEVATGATTETSRAITECGAVIKNYISFLELPQKVSASLDSFSSLQKGTVESVAVFVTDVLGVGKACFEGIELVGTRFGLLSKNVVQFFQPLSSSSTFSFGLKESILKNIPDVRENWGKQLDQATSAMFKLIKNVSYAAVGALSLVAHFFGVFIHPWVFGSLLTVALAGSVSARLFDGIVLAPKPNLV